MFTVFLHKFLQRKVAITEAFLKILFFKRRKCPAIHIYKCLVSAIVTLLLDWVIHFKGIVSSVYIPWYNEHVWWCMVYVYGTKHKNLTCARNNGTHILSALVMDQTECQSSKRQIMNYKVKLCKYSIASVESAALAPALSI